MAKEFFKDLPNTTTPLTATRLNGLLDGEEALGNLVVDSIRTKNMLDYYIPSTNILGVTTSMQSTQLKINGTSTGSGNLYYQVSNSFTLSAGTYTISTSLLSGTFTRNSKEIAIYVRNMSQGSTGTNVFESLSTGNYTKATTITINSDSTFTIYLYANGSGFVANNLIIGCQIEKGDVATTYTPYQNLKNITTSNYESFTFNNTTFGITYIKNEKLAEIEINSGTALSSSNFSVNTNYKITTLPSNFTPKTEICSVLAGYGNAIGTFWITSSGDVYIRLSTNTQLFRLHITFITD